LHPVVSATPGKLIVDADTFPDADTLPDVDTFPVVF